MSLLRHGLAAVLLAAAATQVAAAPTPASVQVDELTWTELRDAIKAGKTTVIVPVGGTEQSGPHIVLGKHNVRARVLAARIAASLGNALVAPVIAYVPEGAIDPPAGHMRFAGTISIPESAFEATLEGAARSFRRAGRRELDDEAGTVHGRADAGVDGAPATARMNATAGRDDAPGRQRAVAFGRGNEPPRGQDEADENAACIRCRRFGDEADGERGEYHGVKPDAERERHGPPAPRGA